MIMSIYVVTSVRQVNLTKRRIFSSSMGKRCNINKGKLYYVMRANVENMSQYIDIIISSLSSPLHPTIKGCLLSFFFKFIKKIHIPLIAAT